MCKNVYPRLKILPWFLVVVAVSLQADDRFERAFPVSRNPSLMLTNYSGTISIKSWHNSEIKAIWTKYSQNVEIDTESNGNKLTLATHVMDKLASADKAKVDYEIYTPEESNVEIRSNLGSVTVEKIKGEVRIDVVDAAVKATKVAGYLNARSLGSKLDISESSGIIQTMTVSGDIVFSKLDSNNVTAQSTLGNIVYEGDFMSGGKYNFSTNEGLISILCSDQASVDWDAKTIKGGISTNLPIKSKSHYSSPKGVYGRQALLGTSNSGDATVQLSTFSGKIKINHK